MNSCRLICLLLAWLIASAILAEEPSAGAEEPRLWRTVDDLPGNRVLALAQAADGYLWVGTAYALARFDGFRFSVFDPQKLGVANLGNVVLESGPENTMWIGTARGEALRWRDGKFTNCLPRGAESDAVQRIYPEGPNDAVILKNAGVWRWSAEQGARLIASPGPLEVTSGLQGITTVRTARDAAGTLYFFAKEKCWRLRGDTYEEVIPASEGITARRLWDAISTADGQVCLLSDRALLWRDAAGKWQPLPPLDDESRWTGHILGVCPDGSVWIYINGRLRRAAPGGWQLDAGPWPPNNLSSPAFTDAAGRLWAALANGRMLCVPMDGKAQTFAGSPQISGNRILRFLMDREGNLWGGTGDSGLVRWTAADLANVTGLPAAAEVTDPVTHLEFCRTAETERLPPFLSQGVTVEAEKSRLEFGYTGILLGAPETVRFRYRLTGLEDDWRESTSRRAAYGAVPPGRYRFEIQTARPGGEWSAAEVCGVTVQGRFWQTTWFHIVAPAAVIACAALGGWLASRRRSAHRMELLELEKVRAAERLRLARDLHDDLGSRLTHLALVADLAHQDDQPDPAALTTLQDGLREAIGSLDEIVWAVDPRRDTLADLAEYLATTLTTFFQSAGIACEIENPVALPAVPVATDARHHLLMAVREAAQNILKHAAATRVVLRWQCGDGQFRITISDNGQGFDPAAITAGDGLRNMRERLSSCGGAVDIQSSPGEGCRITFSLATGGKSQR